MSAATARWCQCLAVLAVCFVTLDAVESASTRLGVVQDDVDIRGEDEANEPSIDSRPSFTVYDYLAVAFMLVISIGIGVFYGWFEQKGTTDANGCDADSSDDFLLGSGMSLFPVALSLTTSFITAIELLGNPSEMFFNGTQFSLIVISMVLVVPIAVKVFYPIYYKLEVTSCYEYLGLRFDKRIRIFGAVLYILQVSVQYTGYAHSLKAVTLKHNRVWGFRQEFYTESISKRMKPAIIGYGPRPSLRGS
uniref:Uncharacterized protein n=1 Tax=Anopheles culicifacies TaxID=139723 RepID=A0A182M0P5_9DIPT